MRNRGWFASGVLALICSGCAPYNNPLLSSGPYPRVEDCTSIQQATPTKYVCGGKTYTSVQLADIRAGKTSATLSGKGSGNRTVGGSVSPPVTSSAPAKNAP
jgi:hypothetical protein